MRVYSRTDSPQELLSIDAVYEESSLGFVLKIRDFVSLHGFVCGKPFKIRNEG